MTVARYVGALLLGALVGLCSVAIHRSAPLGVPAGLLLAVVASLGTAWHLRRGAVPRSASAYCLGWVVVVGLALGGRPEGDYVVAADLSGYALMGTGFLLVAFGVASLAVPGPADRSP